MNSTARTAPDNYYTTLERRLQYPKRRKPTYLDQVGLLAGATGFEPAETAACLGRSVSASSGVHSCKLRPPNPIACHQAEEPCEGNANRRLALRMAVFGSFCSCNGSPFVV